MSTLLNTCLGTSCAAVTCGLGYVACRSGCCKKPTSVTLSHQPVERSFMVRDTGRTSSNSRSRSRSSRSRLLVSC